VSQGEWWERPARRSRAPLVVISTVIALSCGGGAAWYFLRGDQKANATPDAATAPVAVDDPKTLEPMTLGATKPVLDEVFGSKIMSFAIALDKHLTAGEADLARAESALAADDVRDALGADAAKALGDVLGAAKKASEASAEDEPSVKELEIATARFDNAIVRERLPYFLDTSVIVDAARGRRLVLLYEFSIARTDLYTSRDRIVRSVRLRRLDRLNWTHTLLGFVNPYRIQAVVLLDQIDEQLVNHVLPALAADAPLPLLAPEQGAAPADTDPIAARAAKDARAEVAALPDLDAQAATELGDALHARRALFVKWSARAKTLGLRVSLPPRLALDMAMVEREVGTAFPRAEVDELKQIQTRLDRAEVKHAYEILRDGFADSIERHEVQHRLDAMTPIPFPPQIDALVPPGQGIAGDRLRDRMRAELSAYVSQIARDERTPRTTFTLLARFLVDPRMRGTAESYAALIAMEELARDLGVSGVSPILQHGHLDDARIDLAHKSITAVPPEALRESARRVWKRLFAVDLAPVSRL
jgi:hypothetical protein